MNELIKIKTSETGDVEEYCVDARELWKFMGIKSPFSQWFRFRCIDYGFSADSDYIVEKMSRLNNQKGRVIKNYKITMNMAKHLSMIEKGEKGRKARDYFINCETRLKKVQERITKPVEHEPDPEGGLSRLDLIRIAENSADETKKMAIMARESEEARLRTQQKLIESNKQHEKNKPKIKSHDAFMNSQQNMSIGALAKTLFKKFSKTGRNKLFEYLRDNKILISNGDEYNLPFQRYITAGYFIVTRTQGEKGAKVVWFSQTLVTPKGSEYIRSMLEKDQAQEEFDVVN